LFITQF